MLSLSCLEQTVNGNLEGDPCCVVAESLATFSFYKEKIGKVPSDLSDSKIKKRIPNRVQTQGTVRTWSKNEAEGVSVKSFVKNCELRKLKFFIMGGMHICHLP